MIIVKLKLQVTLDTFKCSGKMKCGIKFCGFLQKLDMFPHLHTFLGDKFVMERNDCEINGGIIKGDVSIVKMSWGKCDGKQSNRYMRELDWFMLLLDYSFHFVLNILSRHIVQKWMGPGTSFTHVGGSMLLSNNCCKKELCDNFLLWGPLHSVAFVLVVSILLHLLLWLALPSHILDCFECFNRVPCCVLHLVPPFSSLAAMGHLLHTLRI